MRIKFLIDIWRAKPWTCFLSREASLMSHLRPCLEQNCGYLHSLCLLTIKESCKKNPWYPLASSYIGMKGNMNHQSGHFGQFCLFGLFLDLFRAPFRAARPRPGSLKSRHLFVIAIRSKSAISSWPLWVATCQGVVRMLPRSVPALSTSAPASISNRAILRWPFSAAMCNDGGAAFDIPCLSSPVWVWGSSTSAPPARVITTSQWPAPFAKRCAPQLRARVPPADVNTLSTSSPAPNQKEHNLSMAILSCDLQRCCTKVKRCEICVSSTLNQHTSYFHMAVQSCEVQWGCTRVKPSQVCVSDESTKQRSPHCHCWLHSAMVNDLQHLGHLSLPPQAAALVLHVPSCLVQRSLPICICHSGVARTLKQLFQHHQQHLHGFTAKYFINLNLRQDPSPDRNLWRNLEFDPSEVRAARN